MLISLVDLIKKYSLNIRGIIHIGAHLAEETSVYTTCKINNVVWIEANPNLMSKLRKNVPNNICINAAIYSEDNIVLPFNITNNGESSSLLELETHKVQHPHIYVCDTINVVTKKMSTVFNEYNLDSKAYNFLNIDIQGVELHAIKGFGDLLNNIDYIYTEVNKDYLYAQCNLVHELDDYLDTFGFKRVETSWTKHGWGDALYCKM